TDNAASIPISNSQVPDVCLKWLSLGLCGPGPTVHKSTVDACAAYPHRVGTTQESWSRKIRSVTGTIAPQSTNCIIRDTTSSGMICSLERASDDSSRPSIAAATQVAATTTNSSIVALPSSTAGRVGVPLPSTTMAVAIAAWTMANTQNTAILASR